MKRAAEYAKAASRTNPVYAQKAQGTSKNAYNLAFKDWFNAPAIHSVDVHRDERYALTPTMI